MNCKKCGKSILESCEGLCQECLGFVPNKKEKKIRFNVEIKCGADSLKDLTAALYEINRILQNESENYFKTNKGPYFSVSGCSSFGWIVELQYNPEMTHEKYFKES